MKQINIINFIFNLVVVLLMFPITTISQQYNFQELNVNQYHPDGIYGKLSFHGEIKYFSVTKDPQFPISDIEQASLAMKWVAFSKLTFNSQVDIIKEDSTYYQLSGGFKYYLKNPLTDNFDKNPDGILRSLIFSIKGYFTLPFEGDKKTKKSGIFSVLLPLTSNISFEGGYQYNNKTAEHDVRQSFVGLRFYSGYYVSKDYINPDGPPGNIAIHIKAGTSNKGKFGDLSLLFPIKESLTLKSQFSYEKADFQNKKLLGSGIGFSFYPSVK